MARSSAGPTTIITEPCFFDADHVGVDIMEHVVGIELWLSVGFFRLVPCRHRKLALALRRDDEGISELSILSRMAQRSVHHA